MMWFIFRKEKKRHMKLIEMNQKFLPFLAEMN